jgi:hypothetical protein
VCHDSDYKRASTAPPCTAVHGTHAWWQPWAVRRASQAGRWTRLVRRVTWDVLPLAVRCAALPGMIRRADGYSKSHQFPTSLILKFIVLGLLRVETRYGLAARHLESSTSNLDER